MPTHKRLFSESPTFGGMQHYLQSDVKVLHFKATYDDHLKLIGKRVVDFLLVLIELFSLGVTTEALRANIGSKSAISLQLGPVDPKFKVERVAPTNHSFFLRILG